MKKELFNLIIESCITIFSITLLYIVLEPAITNGANTVSQSVTTEIAFLTPANNIILTPSIDVTAGGQASGQTQVVVKTNDHSGYLMTITASSSLGMVGVASSTKYIPAYVTGTAGIPDYDFSVPANSAYFGYTVEASTTADLAQSFKDSAGVCNSISGGDTADKCWISATSTAYTIINRSSATTLSGATTTLKFLVVINSNPNPGIPNDTYVATTTLTATAN